MNKIVLVVGFIIFVFVSNSGAESNDTGNTAFQAREQERLMNQAQVDPDGQALNRTMEQFNFHHRNIARIQEQLQLAQKQGLPAEPIIDKVHEGIAKQVNEEQIARAVEQVRERYALAYRQAGTIARERQYVQQIGATIANSYTAGLSQAECDRIMEHLRTRTRTMNRDQADHLALQTMETAQIMSRRGVSPETVGSVLANALDHSYQHRDMQTLQHSFMHMTRYQSAETLARQYSTEIAQGAGADNLGKKGEAREMRGADSSGVSDGTNGRQGSSNSQGQGDSGNSSSSSTSGNASNGSNDMGNSSGAGGNSDSNTKGGSGNGRGGSSNGSENSGGSGNGRGR